MKTILAFGASSSRESINRQLANFAANQVPDSNVVLLDLNDFEMPLFSVDIEAEIGSPEPAQRFKDYIKSADALVISFAEHNGSFAAAFKNIVDWTSRIEGKLWENKPTFLLATSPGGRGGQTVLASAGSGYPHLGAQVVSQFSLPSFNANFSGDGITDLALKNAFEVQLNLFIERL